LGSTFSKLKNQSLQKSTRVKDEDCDYDSESDQKIVHVRKRFFDQMLPSSTTMGKGSITFANNVQENYYQDSIDRSEHSKNGHYELVDISSNPMSSSYKNNATITYKLNTFKSQWSNDSMELNGDKNKLSNINQPQQQPHHQQHFSRSSRTHQKSLSTRISSLKRENKTTQTLSIVVGGLFITL
jgi:hypothetical protein